MLFLIAPLQCVGPQAAAAAEKDAEIAEVQKRREEGYVVRAEDSRLKFAEKRDFVDRKKRLEEAARCVGPASRLVVDSCLIWLCLGRRKREEQVEEKDHYTTEVIQQKREYVAMRRDMAIRSMVEVTPADDTTRCLLLRLCMVEQDFSRPAQY
eukprot:COSAG02_NODE_233_length_27847_cov_20.383055_2_plen_153_part_00